MPPPVTSMSASGSTILTEMNTFAANAVTWTVHKNATLALGKADSRNFSNENYTLFTNTDSHPGCLQSFT